jgi:DNA-binding GntR family transcriptional regulator
LEIGPIEPSQGETRVRLSDKAYERIRQEILSLQLAPRSAIDEQALMQELDLGRTPIREALQRLATENLVLLAPRRGMFVAGVSITDLTKIVEVRMCLEGLCARLAAERASPAQLDLMEEIIQRLDVVSEGDGEALIAIDKAFHELLYEMAHNEFMAQALRRLYALSVRMWRLLLHRLGDWRGDMEKHCYITQALQVRDAECAEALLQQHIGGFQQRIKAML